MASGTITVRIFPVPASLGLAPAVHPLEASGTIAVNIGAGAGPSAVVFDPVAHPLPAARADLAARIFARPLLDLTPAPHALETSSSLVARVFPRPAVGLAPTVHQLQASASIQARVFPRLLGTSLAIRHPAIPQAFGRIAVEINPAVRKSYVAALRQDTVERLAHLSQFRRVFDSRQAQISRAMLPAIRVYASQTSEGRSINIPDFLTTTNLVVQVIADDVTDVGSAERVDELCDDVKDWLLGDPEWLVNYERIAGITTDIDRDIEGESRTTVATITFAMTISEWYEPRVPDTLDRVDMKIDVIRPAADPNIRYPGPDGRIEVHGHFERPIPAPWPPLPRRGVPQSEKGK
jgi:hypothetical protein